MEEITATLRKQILDAFQEVKFKALPNNSKKAFFAKLTSGKVKGGKVYPKGKDGKRSNNKLSGTADVKGGGTKSYELSAGDTMLFLRSTALRSTQI